MALTRHYIRMDLAFVGPLGSVMKQLHEAELCLQDLKFELRGSAVGEREADVAGPKAAESPPREKERWKEAA